MPLQQIPRPMRVIRTSIGGTHVMMISKFKSCKDLCIH